MRIIGFTGGIGSGKSTVLKALKDMYDADIIMADELGHLAMEKGLLQLKVQLCLNQAVTNFARRSGL